MSSSQDQLHNMGMDACSKNDNCEIPFTRDDVLDKVEGMEA